MAAKGITNSLSYSYKTPALPGVFLYEDNLKRFHTLKRIRGNLMENKFLEVIKRIQAIAQNGLAYSQNVYDIERYEELRGISVEIMADISETGVSAVKNLFAGETGYQTPKVDVRAVVFKDGKILMVKEKADGCWSLPGGWADVGLSPGEVAVKEVREEAGLLVKPRRLMGILDKKFYPHPPSPYHTYKIFILCESIGGETGCGTETSEVSFFGYDHLPELSMIRNTPQQLRMVFDFLDDPGREAFFD
jgi:ADP-ribose pyrophosphatase YjhB (NUDIX family)